MDGPMEGVAIILGFTLLGTAFILLPLLLLFWAFDRKFFGKWGRRLTVLFRYLSDRRVGTGPLRLWDRLRNRTLRWWHLRSQRCDDTACCDHNVHYLGTDLGCSMVGCAHGIAGGAGDSPLGVSRWSNKDDGYSSA